MSSDQTDSELARKLDTLVKLIAYQLVESKTLSEGAPLLRRLGLTAAEIAAVYDSTANTVNVRISEAKTKTKSKTKQSGRSTKA